MPLVGQNLPRPDGLPKVTGRARYADDIPYDGLYFGATVRSPHAHARITAINWRPEQAPAGAVCITAATLGALNGVSLLDDSWPILAESTVRHVGEPVALVAAPSRLDAQRALEAVDVHYQPLTPVLTVEDATKLPPLYEINMARGDVDATLASADTIIEGEYRTGYQEHIYIECQGVTAWLEPDGTVVVEGSMQCPYYVHKALVHALDLPDKKVRVRASAVGGGFGGKEDYPSMIGLHAAVLARASGHPVRIIYDRHEDIVGTTKRHPSIVTHRTAVDSDGHLLASDIDILLDGGAYLTLSPVVLSRAVLHALGPYRCPNVRVHGRVVATNTATNGAFRGFGVPQAAFAAERHMDRIGRRLGLDPYEIRKRNVLGPGDTLPSGQVLERGVHALDCLEDVAARSKFRERWRQAERNRGHSDDEILSGIGLSLYFHGSGFTGNGERRMRSPVTARLLDDGRIEVLTAMTDMGQGCAIVFPQIAADAAGVTLDDLVFAIPDTSEVPDSGPTVASRTTMIVGATMARVVTAIRDRVLEWLVRERATPSLLRIEAGEIIGASGVVESFRAAASRYVEDIGPLEVTLRHEPPEWQTFDEATYTGAAYPTYAWGADVVEVDVDPDVLEVRARKVTAVCEIGKAVHPTLCAGQIEGGTLQAVGWGLMEEIKVENGRYLNDRLATYIIPTSKDSPHIDVHLLERPWESDACTPKGVGELPMDGAAPALAAAIENATGIEPTEIPATPERLTRWAEGQVS